MNCTKKGFSTEEHAHNFISKALSGRSGWRGNGPLPSRAYLCHCKKWHVTSKPLMTPAQLREQYLHRQMA